VRSDVGGAQRRYSFYAQDGRLLWQRDEVAGARSVNVYLAGSLVAEYRRPLSGTSASVGFLHTDPLGSPIARTDAAGAVIETSEYEPYGLLLNRANDDRAGYTGHVMDSATGLTYMQQRYYDPGIGRFLSVDPVTANSTDGKNFNRYAYVLDNPYKFTDPDGRCEGGRNSPRVCDIGQSGGKQLIPQPSKGVVTVKSGVPEPKSELKTLLQCTADCSKTTLRVTSTDEAIPQHEPGTPHRRGEAADVTVGKEYRKTVLQCAANCGARYGQNEYARPSAKATGGHIHLQLGPGKGGGRGDLPPPSKDED
jgi:RHS repeat-associated protein